MGAGMVLKFDGEPLLPQRAGAAAVWGVVATAALLSLRELTAAQVPTWICLLGLLPTVMVAAAVFGLASGALALVALCRLLAFRDDRLRRGVSRAATSASAPALDHLTP